MKKYIWTLKSESGVNPIKVIMPPQKFRSWRSYDKSLFQSYKAVFIKQNQAERLFGINFGVKSYAQICG
jgi:hypothetical protein